ncbi:hypothetical protein C7212DRAFT_347815 [Tuber magnatum]|uniref:Uncharacterized protein n=1 Tax=Tuber magnatum TaxID=42249 RepID=A0A317SE20_9PEZI|nr:hypothetical protein C7212DRAFT_347815 [Tuber magnatum]
MPPYFSTGPSFSLPRTEPTYFLLLDAKLDRECPPLSGQILSAFEDCCLENREIEFDGHYKQDLRYCPTAGFRFWGNNSVTLGKEVSIVKYSSSYLEPLLGRKARKLRISLLIRVEHWLRIFEVLGDLFLSPVGGRFLPSENLGVRGKIW